jgi:hypothetical protein
MELLSEDELNRIIRIVDMNTSLFKECDVFGTNVHEAHLLNTNTEYLTKTSASLTELIRTDIDSRAGTPTVFLKMWFSWNIIDPGEKMRRISDLYRRDFPLATRIFGPEARFASSIVDNTMTTSLEYEARVYQYITENIILKNISPTFIPILTNNTCRITDLITSINSFGNFTRKTELLEKLTTLNRLFPRLPMNFIMTGSSQTVTTAHDFFRNIQIGHIVLQRQEYSSIMFQFFYALYVMDEFKIVHNDNHMNNVLIQTLPNDVTFDITIGPLNVQFTTRYVVKFFDWDRAYCEYLGPNPISKGFLLIRNAVEFIRGRDFSAFVCFLYARNIPGFNNILNRVVEGPKPSATSNVRNVNIRNGVTRDLREWMGYNTRYTITDIYGDHYITIPKNDLEICVPMSTITQLRNKLGKDEFGSYIYDGPSITNIYLGIKGSDLIIPAGFTCHPMYDSRDLDVVRYFTDRRKFTELCDGLVRTPTAPVYKYGINIPPPVIPPPVIPPPVIPPPVIPPPVIPPPVIPPPVIPPPVITTPPRPDREFPLAHGLFGHRARRRHVPAVPLFGGIPKIPPPVIPPPVITTPPRPDREFPLAHGLVFRQRARRHVPVVPLFGGIPKIPSPVSEPEQIIPMSVISPTPIASPLRGMPQTSPVHPTPLILDAPIVESVVEPRNIDVEPDTTVELTVDEHFLNFAYDVLVQVLDGVLTATDFITVEIVLPVVKTALEYIFEVLSRYLTVDNIIEILKISSYLVFQLGKLSYEAATLIVMNTIVPFIDLIGDKIYKLLSYIYNGDYKEDFYNVAIRLLGEERVERLREYISVNVTSFLDIPSSIKRALQRRFKLFGTRETRKTFGDITKVKLLQERGIQKQKKLIQERQKVLQERKKQEEYEQLKRLEGILEKEKRIERERVRREKESKYRFY